MDHLFERGWLPDIIPISSVNITTKNNLDLNTSEGEFFFSPDETSDFTSKIQLINELDQNYKIYSYTNHKSVWTFHLKENNGYCKYVMNLIADK